MKNRIAFLLIQCCTCSFFSFTQSSFSSSKDTLTFTDYSSGIIHSFDISSTPGASLLPGIGFANTYQYITAIWLMRNPSLQGVKQSDINRTFKFSALPHLGFFYSFGSKGYQSIHMDYTQSFEKNGTLNLDLKRNSTNGLVRNSNFDLSDFYFGHLKNTGRFKTSLLGNYITENRALNGGFQDSASFVQFGPEFAPIFKSNAKSTWRLADVEWENRFSITSDSAILQHGPAFLSTFQLKNRVYEESDTLYGIYSVINIDSLQTRDQYQENNWCNGLGYFVGNKKIDLSFFANYQYRRLQNLGITRDTQETNVKAQLSIQLGKWMLNGTGYLNIIGAKQENKIKGSLVRQTKKINFEANAYYENLLPQMQQRYYFANNINYTTNLALQSRIGAQAKLAYQLMSNLELSSEIGGENREGILQWNGEKWTQGSLTNVNFVFAKVSGMFHWKSIVLKPFAEVNYGLAQLPNTVFGGRLAVSKRIFKAKKMELLAAVDVISIDGYQLMLYSPLMDAYQTNTGSIRSNSSRLDVHATLGFGIEEFRFFIRAENINRLGHPDINNVQLGVFNTPFVLRIGISWDFFN